MSEATARLHDGLVDKMLELGIQYDATLPFDWRSFFDRLGRD